MKIIAIPGSASSSGRTVRITRMCLERLGGELIDLTGHRNRDDDFLKIAGRMAAADGIIFATPVYWYSMSAQLKIFIDRLSDLVSSHPLVAENKPLGRSLAGRYVWLIATGSDAEPPPGFEVPFRLTSQYFGMIYGGMLYCGEKSGSAETLEEAVRTFSGGILTQLERVG